MNVLCVYHDNLPTQEIRAAGWTHIDVGLECELGVPPLIRLDIVVFEMGLPLHEGKSHHHVLFCGECTV